MICQILSCRIFRDKQVLACQSVTFSTHCQSPLDATFVDWFNILQCSSWIYCCLYVYSTPPFLLSLRLRITKCKRMCSVENRIATFWKRWLGDSSAQEESGIWILDIMWTRYQWCGARSPGPFNQNYLRISVRDRCDATCMRVLNS